jgi:deoxycytidylate deaminase
MSDDEYEIINSREMSNEPREVSSGVLVEDSGEISQEVLCEGSQVLTDSSSENYDEWITRFMAYAVMCSKLYSKSNTEQAVGCCLVAPDKFIMSAEYGSKDAPFQECAEKRAIDYLLEHGCSLEGYSVYTTRVPCSECYEYIIKNKINTIVTMIRDDENELPARDDIQVIYYT